MITKAKFTENFNLLLGARLINTPKPSEESRVKMAYALMLKDFDDQDVETAVSTHLSNPRTKFFPSAPELRDLITYAANERQGKSMKRPSRAEAINRWINRERVRVLEDAYAGTPIDAGALDLLFRIMAQHDRFHSIQSLQAKLARILGPELVTIAAPEPDRNGRVSGLVSNLVAEMRLS